ncbi:acyltransferase family protein [Vagococcus entomophilus]|uniref:acyltransferase family protein n=1 Tax=Vagococcus entomophilus TaxID=1160095 RepID=UPI0014752217|nr:acyltransferase family protein [Vagococcus entomophilus]
MKQNIQRDPYFDNAKFILIFLVIFTHFIQPFGSDNEVVETLYFFVYTFHMPAFVLIAGYFSKKFYRVGYFKDKVNNLLKLYLFFQLAYSLFYFLIQEKTNFSLQLMYPEWSLWFLLSLFFWNVLLLVFSKFPPFAGVLFALVLGLISGYIGGIDSFMSISRTLVFFPFYLTGYYLKRNHFSWIKEKIPKFASVSLFLLVGLGFIWENDWLNKYWLFGSQPYTHFLENPEYGAIVRLLVYVVSFVTVTAFFTFVPQKHYFFTKWGRNTLYAYLLHGFFIKTFRTFDIQEFPMTGEMFSGILFFSFLLTTFLSSETVLKYMGAFRWFRIKRKAYR